MKQCPFCAEEIQDAAIVCKHCGRDLKAGVSQVQIGPPPAKTSPAAMGCLGLILFVVIIVIIGQCNSQTVTPGKPILAISGGKSVTGVIVTNRETDSLKSCAIVILEKGSPDKWTAVVDALDPMQSVTVRWESFQLSGHPMPSYIGASAKYATVECESHREVRTGAGFAFNR